ncbi:Asp23/Gls24 family envelope stress response protein [Lacticaseibacillus brantae]|uniref:Stress response regulator gls24 homolog n=1 Tax=Lacticaseibacillus brantae DSM 23927 TaxID=1423727 RepID=A0A0R2AYI4_9LACO|nr:Asp23/Gls24 family envelope stress response protein [Lacticaseibacillus brantae]KRM71999.1 hypothetical protein FC34_GL000981 [Lacticaseibacillus brantae DSM 23927]
MDAKAKATTTTQPVSQELVFDDSVVQKIVGKTSADVNGIVSLEGGMFSDMTNMFRKDEDPKQGVSVDIEDNQTVKIELDATMKYGVKAPKIFNEVVTSICNNVQDMTGLKVTDVKMTVKDMLTDEEVKRQEAKQSDDKAEA